MKTPLALILLLACTATRAQDYRDIRSRYPGEDLVILNNKSHVQIRIVNDSPVVDSREEEEWIYLTEKGSMMKKEGWISHSGFRELGVYSAYTMTPKGRKLDATDAKTTANTSEGIFYDDSKLTSFKFPGLTEGAVTHQEYVLRFRNPYLLTPHYFSMGIPTVHNELRIQFPKNVKVRYVIKGVEKDRVKFREEKHRQDIVYIFTVENMPREDSYPDAPERPHWSTHVVFFIEAYQKADGTWQNILSSPDDLYTLYKSYTSNINKTVGPELARITDSLTKGKKNAAEKASAIYHWAQHHIKYVAFEDGMEGFIPRDANLVCARRYGDCKDFASILTTMLKHAGLKAYYTWIGTRGLPYTYQETPTPVVDNHMICALDLDGNFIFLDGTDQTCTFGWPSEGIQGKEAMIAIDEKNYRIMEVPIASMESNSLRDTTFMQFTEKGVKGRIHMVMHGYYAMNFISRLTYMNGKERDDYMKQWLGRGSNKFTYTSYRITDSSAAGDRIGVTAEFEIPDYGKTLGDDRFVNLNLHKPYEHEEIDFPKRKIPVSYKFRYHMEMVTILDIPEGYKTDYLPQAESFQNEAWGYDMRYEQKERQILFSQRFNHPQIMVKPGQFEAWNKVLEKLLPQYKESVSITKQ